MWTFLVADRRAGSVKVASPNTEEAYEITRWGSWVPTVDVEGLLKQTRMVCCGEGGGLISVKVFAEGRPTQEQMRKRPTRNPRMKRKTRTKSRSGQKRKYRRRY
jgi:hypothetical protein